MSKRRLLLAIALLVPAGLLVGRAAHLQAERERAELRWSKVDVVPLTPEGRVVLPADPSGSVLHAVLVDRSAKEASLEAGTAKAFRWRLRGKPPHPIHLGAIVETAHGGVPVELEYDVTPETSPLIDRLSLSVRQFPVLYKRDAVERHILGLQENAFWGLAAVWAGGWGVGVLLAGRKRPRAEVLMK